MASSRKRILWIIGSVVGAVILYFSVCVITPLIGLISSNASLSKEQIAQKIKESQAEYSSLFRVTASNDIAFSEGYVTPSNYPILKFIYLNKYNVIIQKVVQSNDQMLSQFVSIRRQSYNPNTSTIYKGFGSGSFDIHYIFDQDSLSKHIFVTYSDSIIEQQKFGEDLIYYTFFSEYLSYGNEEQFSSDVYVSPYNQYLQGKGLNRKEMSIAIYKKGLAIYLILVLPYAGQPIADEKIFFEFFGKYDSR